MECSCDRVQISNILLGLSETIGGEFDRSTYRFTHQSHVL